MLPCVVADQKYRAIAFTEALGRTQVKVLTSRFVLFVMTLSGFGAKFVTLKTLTNRRHYGDKPSFDSSYTRLRPSRWGACLLDRRIVDRHICRSLRQTGLP